VTPSRPGSYRLTILHTQPSISASTRDRRRSICCSNLTRWLDLWPSIGWRAVAIEKAEQDKEENHEGTWTSLDAMQRQILLLFVNDPQAKLFGKTALAKLAKALGVPSLAPTDVQYSRNSLKVNTIISKVPSGVYTFERWLPPTRESHPAGCLGGVPNITNMTSMSFQR